MGQDILKTRGKEEKRMKQYPIAHISQKPEWKDALAVWFHEKWGVPLEAYQESIEASLEKGGAVPSWYLCLDGGKIIGGLGVIENDFHERKDLAPNVCALYVLEEYRCRGIAGRMLDFVCRDMKAKGIDTLYLATDHEDFYERYGWKFLCMAREEGETSTIRIYAHFMEDSL